LAAEALCYSGALNAPVGLSNMKLLASIAVIFSCLVFLPAAPAAVIYPEADHDFVKSGEHYDVKAYDDALQRTLAKLNEFLPS
jgi:dienelactone hydrolase